MAESVSTWQVTLTAEIEFDDDGDDRTSETQRLWTHVLWSVGSKGMGLGDDFGPTWLILNCDSAGSMVSMEIEKP